MPQAISDALLSWYDCHRRSLPWRSEPGVVADPYHVWLSEIMLQQTTVATVTPRFEQFLSRWPTVEALAAGSLDDVLHEWQGLGYYARARNLHKCAQVVSQEYGGHFPKTETGLISLPGIGDYTAAAIAAIAFGEATAPVDGNIIRVVSRLLTLKDEMPKNKALIRERLLPMAPLDRPGDFAQALMDLGSRICKPKSPDCGSCPLAARCLACKEDNPEEYPRRSVRGEKPTRYGVVYWIVDADGRVYLQRRAEKGLLGGMMEFPSSEWCGEQVSLQDKLAPASFSGMEWEMMDGQVRHTFTHFHLRLNVQKTHVGTETGIGNGYWSFPDDFDQFALPTVMKKVAHLIASGEKT